MANDAFTLAGVVNALAGAKDTYRSDHSVSLFKYARRAILTSRVYIEENLSTDEILSPLMQNIMNLYVGLILTALGLDRAISGSKTIRDKIDLVGTESFKIEKVQELVAAVEDYFGFSPKMASATVKDTASTTTVDEKVGRNTTKTSNRNSDTNEFNDTITGKIIDTQGKEVPLPCGRLIQIDLDTGSLITNETSNSQERERARSSRQAGSSKSEKTYIEEYEVTKKYLDGTEEPSVNPSDTDRTTIVKEYNPQDRDKPAYDSKKEETLGISRSNETYSSNKTSTKLTLNLFLQLSPMFINSSVARQFVGLNFQASRAIRWQQVKAGEISFFKDFLLGCDIVRKRNKAILADKTGALRDMVAKQQSAVVKHWEKEASNAVMGSDFDKRANIANTILIFEKHSFDQACSATGLKWNNEANRQRFFDRTYAMMLCIVDPMYGKVEMYYNGLPAFSVWKYDQVKRNAKSEQIDLGAIMKNYAANMAPKF